LPLNPLQRLQKVVAIHRVVIRVVLTAAPQRREQVYNRDIVADVLDDGFLLDDPRIDSAADAATGRFWASRREKNNPATNCGALS